MCAVIKRGILGGMSGRVANVVGSSWKGIAVLKSLPLSVANPRTAAQVNQRDSFKGIVEVAQILLVSIVKPLWDRFAQGMSGYNSFISANIDTFVNGVFTNFSDFMISRGNLTNSPILTVTAVTAQPNVILTFNDNSGTGNALSSDTCSLVVYNLTKDIWSVNEGSATRADETVDCSFGVNITTGDLLKVYLGFKRADGTNVSNTEFFAKTVTAS